MNRFRYLAATASAAILLSISLISAGMASAAASPASGYVPVEHLTAVTAVTGDPDSGSAGNTWASDAFTRKVTITRLGQVSVSYCPGQAPADTNKCYAYYASAKDWGTFTTIAGQTVPGVDGFTGTAPKIGVAVTGNEWGWFRQRFYSNWKTIKASLVPASVDMGGVVPSGRQTTSLWATLFFQPGAKFWTDASQPVTTSVLTVGGWHYTLKFGADTGCPNDAYRWVDSSFTNWGSAKGTGNILAPAAGSC